jgi:catechol 2,3-dioxygenase-like lactoylglutathione lyase family enzyme
MTKKHAGQSWMPAEDYGRTLPAFTVNLLVSDIVRSVEFYRSVLGAKLVYSDCDFAALRLRDLEFMLHADHAYDHHPWYAELTSGERRGLGVLQTAQEKPHGWRDVIVADPDGYAWAIGTPTKVATS